MKNFVQNGYGMTVPAPYTVASGAGVLVGAMFGIATGNAEQGASIEITMEGVFDLPKKAGDTPALGGKLYWDDAARTVTTTAAGNTLVGVSALTTIGSDAEARVRLNGAFA